MKDSVRKAFVPFTVAFEGGYIGWMFPDVKGLVSTGFGLLLDPVAMALTLPWKRADGTLASREEIVEDFNAVKNYPNAARLGHKSVEHVAKLRLDNDGLEHAFQGKLNQMESYLKKRFLDFEEWPADAQLATLSMAWACGPAFRFPKLEAALWLREFDTAAIECFMPEEKTIGGLRPRNAANRILYQNAAIVQAEMCPDDLYWPCDLTTIGVDPTKADTEPAPPSFPIIHPRVPLGGPDDEPPEAA